MSTHDHDNDALPGEDELKALYRSLPRKEPSPALDRAVKRAAADAVRPAHRRTVPRWPVAAASVAMVVVAAGLGWRMLQQPSSVPQIPSAASVPAAPASVPPPAPAAAPQPAPAPASPVAAEPAAPASLKAPRKATPPWLPEHENIRSAMKPKLAARTVAPAPPPAVMESAAPVMQAPQATANAAYAPQPMPLPAPPAPAPAVQMQVAPAEAPAPALASPAPPAAATGGFSHYAAPMRAVAAPSPIPAQDATAFDPADTPDQELAKIRQLFALHRHDEAVQRLQAFRQAHPDTPLPDDLRAQLPDHE